MTDFFDTVAATTMADLFDATKAPEKVVAPPERALVFVKTSRLALFLVGFGPGIESDIEAGFDVEEIGPTTEAPGEPGLWIWEGTPLWVEARSMGVSEGSEPDYRKRGTWRRPTPEETARVAAGDLSQFVKED